MVIKDHKPSTAEVYFSHAQKLFIQVVYKQKLLFTERNPFAADK